MAQKYKFRAVIEDAGDGGAFVTIPFDVEAAFGKKRVKVKAQIEGESYRGTLVRMGGPNHLLLVLKEIRQKIGKSFGDEIEIELEEDTEARVVDIPQELKEALGKNPQAQTFFEKLSYSHQREYVQWIEEAKREQTRQTRILRTIENLEQGKREH